MAAEIRCRAVVVTAPNAYAIEEVIVEPPRAGEVRVKIIASSVCHTDL
jgi:S-(hydroxymethyl)glutathione dehydrogenase / alcohol dehydrogenase